MYLQRELYTSSNITFLSIVRTKKKRRSSYRSSLPSRTRRVHSRRFLKFPESPINPTRLDYQQNCTRAYIFPATFQLACQSNSVGDLLAFCCASATIVQTQQVHSNRVCTPIRQHFNTIASERQLTTVHRLYVCRLCIFDSNFTNYLHLCNFHTCIEAPCMHPHNFAQKRPAY